MPSPLLFAFLVVAGACTSDAAEAPAPSPRSAQPPVSSAPIPARPPGGPSGDRQPDQQRPGSVSNDTSGRPAPRIDTSIVRGLYVNRWASQGPKAMARLIGIADRTEINAFVIDIKDEFGINYVSRDTLVRRNAGRAGAIPNLSALLDTLDAHGIMAIARIVVFKDSVTARLNPEFTIRDPAGNAWRDKEGLAWVNPYHPAIWEYNIRIAEEVARLGFDEIQWDYIRFPEPYKSLPQQVFPGAEGRAKPTALAGFLDLARRRLGALGVRSTADVFGLVTTVPGALEIGQSWQVLSPKADVMLPMVYPSHYPRGAFGIQRPNADPYGVVYAAISKAHERDLKLGIQGEHVRTWLQAFTLGQPPYGAREIELQKKAVYDAGYEGWVMWHPGSKYDTFLPALERETVSRKKDWKPGTPPSPPPAPPVAADSGRKAPAVPDTAQKPLPVQPPVQPPPPVVTPPVQPPPPPQPSPPPR